MARLGRSDLLWGAGNNKLATPGATLRTEIDDLVGPTDDVEVMFDHQHRCPTIDQAL